MPVAFRYRYRYPVSFLSRMEILDPVVYKGHFWVSDIEHTLSPWGVTGFLRGPQYGGGGWFGCTSSHARNSCVPVHMQIARKIWDFVSLFCMVLQSENAFLTLPNGQETKKKIRLAAGYFSFSDCFPFSVWLEIRWVYFVEIGIFVFVFTFSFSTHFANPRSSRRSGIPGRCLKNAFLSSTVWKW